jgi:hypothetical protein
VIQCVNDYNISEETKHFDGLVSILVCNGITFDELMDRNSFYDSYINRQIVIEREDFMNENDFNIGYIILDESKDGISNGILPFITLKLKHVKYVAKYKLVI